MDIHTLLLAWSKERPPAVMATIISTSGHSYRKLGAAMLLTFDRRTYGSISPGCIESDLHERTADILLNGNPEIILYNMQPEEDAIWGEMTGCGGTIEVLLEPITKHFQLLLHDALHMLQHGIAVIVKRSWESKQWIYQLEVTSNQEIPPYPAEQLVAIWKPQPRLILFGAGSDVIPICAIAKKAGFRVIVADWRIALCTAERFPNADQLISGSVSAILSQLAMTPSDYIVLCSHQLHQDQVMLAHALQQKLHYIGIIGSRKRISLLFDHTPIPKQVYAPVGLDIGAEGPYEIAISIVAQLIGIHREKDYQSRRFDPYDETHSSYLSGGGTEPAHGCSEADVGAVLQQHTRQHGSSCIIS